MITKTSKKSPRLRITLSIVVMSLFTVFLFQSNSAKAQTYQRVDYVKYNLNASCNPVGSTAVNITSATLSTADAYSGTADVLYSYFYANGTTQNNDNIKAIMVYKVPNGASSTTNVLLTKQGEGAAGFYPISSVTDLRALSTFVMYDQHYSPITYTYNTTDKDWKITTDTSTTNYPGGYWITELQATNTYNKTFKLTQNITFSSSDDIYAVGTHNFSAASNFLPIGGWANADSITYEKYEDPASTTIHTVIGGNGGYFCGIFDGQNYTISGIKILKDSTATYDYSSGNIGLFGRIHYATIQNLYLTNANIQGYQEIGGLIGLEAYSTITNCYVSSSTIQGGQMMGGFCGIATYKGGINNCYIKNSTIHTNIHLCGGFCGVIQSMDEGKASYDGSNGYCEIQNSYVDNVTINNSTVVNAMSIGGFIAYSTCNAKIDNCYVKDTKVYGHTQVGGFAAANDDYAQITNSSVINGQVVAYFSNCGGFIAASSQNSSISSCCVRGTSVNLVATSETAIDNGDEPGHINAGGFCGATYLGSTIDNCYVSSTQVTTNKSKNSGCFTGLVSNATTTNCYSTATIISNNSTETTFGGFYGWKNDNPSTPSTFTNCHYIDSWNQSNILGITENSITVNDATKMKIDNSTTMKATDFVTTMGTTNFKEDATYGTNNGYPILSWQTAAMADPYRVSPGEDLLIPSGTTTAPTTIIVEDGGSFINNSTLNPTIKVERKLKVGAWNLFGLTQNTTTNVNTILNSNSGTESNAIHDMAAVKYDYVNNKWNTTTYLGTVGGTGYTDFAVGEGYFVYPMGDLITVSGSNVTYPGTTNSSEYTIVSQTGTLNASSPISTTVNVQVANSWIALSNPYSGKVGVSNFLTTENTNQMQGAVYVFDPTLNAWRNNLTSDNTYVYNTSTQTYSSTSTGKQLTTIKPGEGFMIASNSTTGEKTFKIEKPTSAIAKSVQTNQNNNTITFAAIANNTAREVLAQIDENADNGFDQKDAIILISANNTELVEPYFLVGDKQILKNEFKTLPYYAPINFHASKESNTDFTVFNIPEDIEVSVIDINNCREKILNNGEVFNFVANQGENSGRFVVKFAKNSVGIDNNAEENNISLAMYPNPATSQTTLMVDGLTNSAKVFVNDVQGRTINTYTINKGQSIIRINTEGLASGVYYVRVVSNNLIKTEKLIVK